MKNKNNYSKAKELRAQARDRLKNRWGVAIFAFVIALALGAVGGMLSFTISEDIATLNWNFNSDETVVYEDVGDYTDGELVDDFAYQDEIYMAAPDHEEYIQNLVNYFIIIAKYNFVYIYRVW